MKTVLRLRFTGLWFASLVAIFAADPIPEPSLVRAVRVRAAAEWQQLLQKKADVKARDAASNTALHHAALNHDQPAVEALLAAGAEPDAKNAAEATPLLYGAGHAEIVRALLARGANPNAESKYKSTPLIAAVSHADSFEAARLLLEAGADVHAVKKPGEEIMLSRAVEAGDRRTVDLLIARGAAKNSQAASVALQSAAWLGDSALVRLLADRGADLNHSDGFTGHALNLAFYGGHLDVARLLVELGADLNLRSPRGHGMPPMVWSAYNDTGDPTVARLLIAKGVDVNTANDAGATALSFAGFAGPDTPLVHYLREAGAKAPEPARVRQMPDRAVPPTPAARAALARERLQSTLDLLARSSGAFLDNAFVQRARCTSCHQQDLPAVAFELARSRGLRVDDAAEGRQHQVLTDRWNARAESARQMTQPVPDPMVSIGYGFFGLKAAHYAPDEMSDALIRYLLRVQKPDGSWAGFDRRPPMEDGPVIAMEPETLVLPHRQPHTFEVLLPLRGRFVVLTFDDAGRVTERAVLGEECSVLELPANTWHAVLSLDKGGVIFEVKHGPYAPIAKSDIAGWSHGRDAAELNAWYAKAAVGERFS